MTHKADKGASQEISPAPGGGGNAARQDARHDARLGAPRRDERGARAAARLVAALCVVSGAACLPPVFAAMFMVPGESELAVLGVAGGLGPALIVVGAALWWRGARMPRTVAVLLGLMVVLWAELGARTVVRSAPELAAPCERIARSLDASGALFQGQALTHFRGRSGRVYYPDAQVLSRGVPFNAYGFIGPQWSLAKPQGIVRVACLGGSTTATGYPRALEDILNAAPGETPYEVLNFGTGYWTSLHSVVNYMLNGQAFAPDVVVFHHGWNEIEAVVNTRTMRPDYSHAYKAYAPARPPASLRPLLRISVLARLGVWRVGAPDWMNLWHAIYQPRERDLTLIDRPERWRPYERAVRTLAALVRANGARLVVVTQPRSTSAQARYAEEAPAIDAANAVARRVAASMPEVTLLDLAETLTGQNDLYTDLAHMTAAGQQAKARAIARAVVSALRGDGAESVRAPGEGAAGVAR